MDWSGIVSITIPAFQEHSYRIASEHGWWEDERTFGDIIALGHSELSEALDEWFVKGRSIEQARDDFAEEFADTLIRVADTSYAFGINIQSAIQEILGEEDSGDWSIGDLCEHVGKWTENSPCADTESDRGEVSVGEAVFNWITPLTDVPGRIAYMHKDFSDALEVWRDPQMAEDGRMMQIGEHFARLFIRIADFFNWYRLDLEVAIIKKMARNEQRPYRHGGKRL